MKKQFLNQLSTLTLLTVVGSTTTLLGSQKVGQAESLTIDALTRQAISDVSDRTTRSVFANDRAVRTDNTLSRSDASNSNEILKTLPPSVVGENTVQEASPAVVESTVKPTARPAKNAVTPASVKPPQKPTATAANKNRVKARKQGMASWYGPGFHGRRTASGERFNAGDLTAAHRYLPFGTRVRVTNARTGRSVVVRINDRGPFSGGRVIDLSRGAAAAIGVFQSGVAPVLLEVLGR
jgi:rare lipoprotein A